MVGFRKCTAPLMVSLLLVVGCITPPAGRVPEQYPVQIFNVTDRRGQVYVRGELKNRSEQAPGGLETREKDQFLEEGIELWTRGYFYHPNLIDWDAYFRLGLSQQAITINNQQLGTQGNLLGYSLSALILREKPVSFRLFASESNQFLDRDFAQRIEFTSSRRGVEILGKGNFPFSLLLESLEALETGDIRQTEQQTKHLRFSISDRRDRDWLTSLTYEHTDTDETSIFFPAGGGAPITQLLPVKRDEINLSNFWRFGTGEQKSSLSGLIRILRRSGFFPNDIFTADQRLNLVHSNTFSTFYRGLFSINKTDVERDRILNAEVGFLKKIYESLEIMARTNIFDESFLTGSRNILGAFLDLRYRKMTGIGIYTSSLSLGKERQNEKSTTGLRSIRDESITLVGLGFFPLSEVNVLTTSIVVTNVSKSVIYVEGVDYQVQTVGVVIEIGRLAAGGIADGQTVLVSYTAQIGRDTVFSKDRINWFNRMQLKDLPLSVYFNYRLLNEELQSGDNPGNLEREEVKLVGIELNYKGINAAAEHEIDDRRLFPPSTSDRLRMSYNRQLGQAASLAVGGRAERVQYSKAEEFGLQPGRASLNSFGGFIRLSMRLDRSMLLRLQGDYTRNRGRQNDALARISLGLEGTYRTLDFSVEARHDVFQQELTNGATDSITFNVKRRF